jgi:hypothetical protein
MMHLDNLDVEIFRIQRTRRLLDQHCQQIDAEAHIAAFDDRRMARRRRDPGVVLGRAAGCADHMHDAGLRRISGKLHGRRRHAEIEHAVRLGEDR